MGKNYEAAYNDSAFLYLIFTALFFVILYLSISLLRGFFAKRSSSQGARSPTVKSLLVKLTILILISMWFAQVYQLIQEDAAN